MSDLSEGSEYSEYSEYSEESEEGNTSQGGTFAGMPFPMIGPDGNPLPAMPGMPMPGMPGFPMNFPMLGPDGQPMVGMPEMNFLPPMLGPDGQPLPMLPMPMLDPNGQPMPMFPLPGMPMPGMIGPDGNPIPFPAPDSSAMEEFMRNMLNLQLGGEGAPMPMMLGPDGQPLPMPAMPMMNPVIGPDGQPLPLSMPMMPMFTPDGQPIPMPGMPMVGPDGQPLPFLPMGMNMNQAVPTQQEEEEEEEEEDYSDDLSGEPIEETSDELLVEEPISEPKRVSTTPKEIQISEEKPEIISQTPNETSTPPEPQKEAKAAPAKSEELVPVDIEKALSTLSTRAALLQGAAMKSKREAAKVDKKQKLIAKIPAKQEQELAQFKEKTDAKVKAAQSKMEMELEKVKQALDRELKNFEKQQTKELKEQDAQYEEITRTTNQTQDKLIQTTEAALQASRKEAKEAYMKEKNSILAKQKEELASKKRKKATFDKKYMKQLKITHKSILTIAEKLYATELEYLKKSSDLELQQQQQSITCDLVEQTNKEIFLNKLKMLQAKTEFDFAQYSSLMGQKLDLLQVYYGEQIQALKQIHDLERRMMERRFKEEADLQQILVQSVASFLKKEGKSKQEIEAEVMKLSKLTTEELDRVQKEQESLLEARLSQESKEFAFSQRCEIYEMKLETTKQKVDMAKAFHKEENDLLVERKGKDLHSLQEGHADMVKNNVDAQKELFNFLGQKKSEIEPLVKDLMEEHRESVRDKIVTFFGNKNRLLATTFKAKNAVQQKRQENATIALTETYDIRLKNLKEKAAQEMREYEESVAALEATEPKR